MPIYEYCCRKCGKTFEALRRMAQEGQPACPVCGGSDADKLLSAPAVHTRGASLPCGAGQCAEAPSCAGSGRFPCGIGH